MVAQEHALIGLGANLGDPRAAFRAALRGLACQAGITVLRVSSLHASRPVDADGPDYLNAVALLAVRLSPLALLEALQAQEGAAGRTRAYRNAPRTLDLDLILYGTVQLHTPRLTLPHPRAHGRRFVLEPAHEVWPDALLPGHGPLAVLLLAVADQDVRRLVEEPPWYGTGGWMDSPMEDQTDGPGDGRADSRADGRADGPVGGLNDGPPGAPREGPA
jgi:2-amino-4-hydroxy-6-hydroxymethyldihydropteridine diphosphokinase